MVKKVVIFIETEGASQYEPYYIGHWCMDYDTPITSQFLVNVFCFITVSLTDKKQETLMVRHKISQFNLNIPILWKAQT